MKNSNISITSKNVIHIRKQIGPRIDTRGALHNVLLFSETVRWLFSVYFPDKFKNKPPPLFMTFSRITLSYLESFFFGG